MIYLRLLTKFGIKVLFRSYETLVCKGLMRHLFVNSLANFLKDRKQRVVLNGHHSKWVNVEPEVPQGSFLGPLLFFIYK